MKQLKKTLYNLFFIPITPIIIFFAIYLIIRIIIETGIIEFMIESEKGNIIDDSLSNKIKERYWFLKPVFRALSTIAWIYIFKYLILHN